MKYRKKPVVIEAFRWTGDAEQEEDPIWVIKAIERGEVAFVEVGTPYCTMKISTLEGIMTAQLGDYVIQGVKGELYPCKPEIFLATYEPVT